MKCAHPDISIYDTFPKLLAYNAEHWPNEIALREKAFGIWEIAVHAVGGMNFGIYQDSLNEEVAYLINYAGARLILAEDEEQVDKVLEITELCPGIEYIVYCDPRGMRKYDDPRLISLEELLKRGAAHHSGNPDAYSQMIESACPG